LKRHPQRAAADPVTRGTHAYLNRLDARQWRNLTKTDYREKDVLDKQVLLVIKQDLNKP
jgi:hypothetical protein